jgi:predicted transcriptional regulator
MYLFQALTEEQGIEPSKAKVLVVEKALEVLQKFEGEKKSGLVKPAKGNNFMVKTLRENVKQLKSFKQSPQIKYLADSIEMNLEKLINENKLV